MRRWLGIVGLALGAAVAAAGCEGDSAEREKKIHDEAAKAAAEAKPKLEEASRAGKAAVGGAKEGWEKRGKQARGVNSGSEDDLTGMPWIVKHKAKSIMASRPYKDN